MFKNELHDIILNEYSEQYMEKIYYFCLKKTSNPNDAEDLTSDITLAVFTQLHKGNKPHDFSSWVWQIARNQYSRWAERKRIKIENFYSDNIENLCINDSVVPENEILKNEELVLLRRELAFISCEYRNVIVPYYLNDISLKNIALSLQITESAAKMRLFRARKILKEGMDMTREFGKRSYQPEKISFSSSGPQPSGLPFKAVQRKIPKNILLQANNNPSTIEELAMELGIALPYIEEEVGILEESTLLKKVGDKYITNFFIFDSETQIKIYEAQIEFSKERSRMADKIADDLIPLVREIGAVRNNMSDSDIKWWFVLRIIDYCVMQIKDYTMDYPEKRSSGETWGFVGYEDVDLPNCSAGHNGYGNDDTMFWTYKICDYNMWERAGEMDSQQAVFLGNVIKNSRNYSSFTETEKKIGIDKRFSHIDSDGNIIPDILVFENNSLDKINHAVQEHELFSELMKNIESVFDKTIEILKKSSSEILHEVLSYCASVSIMNIRMMTVRDEVESGKLIVPEDVSRSTVAMWMTIK